MFFLHRHIAIFLPFNAAVQLATWATAISPTSQLLFLPCSISSYYMATPACFCMATANQEKWQLLFHLHGNYQLFHLFVHSSTPSFEMAFLAHHTFLTFFKMSTMATAARYAWKLLTGPHGNSYSTYMETIICSSNNVRVFFSG